jgi:hypothetical protein
MTVLSAFTDFVASTGSSYLTSADELVNECVKNTYVLRRFLKGADRSFVIQGGQNIKDVLLLDYTSTAQQYTPNDTFSYSNPQNLTSFTVDWRFTADHMSYTDQEIELQAPMTMTDSALRGLFKKVKFSKEQRLWTSTLNYMEDLLWRTPNNSEMEASATGTYPYSILSMVNEFTNGLYNTTDTTGLAGGNWTTLHQIAPGTYSRWVPQQQIYNDTSLTSSMADQSGTATAGTGLNILQAFDRMIRKVKFVPPPTRSEYFESDKLFSQVIFCSGQGLNIYQNLLRQSQDRFTGIASYQDPAYASPAFAGIDLQYVAALDTALTSTSASTLYTEGSSSATNQGPRYFWINGQYLCPVFHSSRYFTKHEPMRPVNQPFTTVVVCDTWWNLVCRSRQRQGVVYPQGALYTY